MIQKCNYCKNQNYRDLNNYNYTYLKFTIFDNTINNEFNIDKLKNLSDISNTKNINITINSNDNFVRSNSLFTYKSSNYQEKQLSNFIEEDSKSINQANIPNRMHSENRPAATSGKYFSKVGTLR